MAASTAPRQSISVLRLRPVVAALLDAGQPGATATPASSVAERRLETFYGATDLTPQILADQDARVSPAQFCVAWAELLRLTGEPQIALRMADRLPQGAFGIVEYVCRSAPTLGDALRHWVRFLNLLDDAVEVGLAIEGDRASLRVVQESEAPAPASHELCFAVIVAATRELCVSPPGVVKVELTHRTQGDPAVYRRWFDGPVIFGAMETQLVFARSALDVPLRTADPQLLAILSRHAQELATRNRSVPPVIAQVERILRKALRTDDAQVDQVARELGLTGRSLQRRLKDEGTSFQVVRDTVRCELAARYLEDDLSMAEISFLLGFSEPSAFFRAFKRWTGLTPLESRARARGRAAATA
jgi:AraC-like DNA-binding protein